MKRLCSKCKIEKPLEDFHKDRTKKYERSSTCKVCSREYSREYHAKKYSEYRTKKVEKIASEYKVCSKCKVEKLKTEFYKDNITPDKYCYNCKSCQKETKKNSDRDINEYARSWRENNPDKTKRYSKNYLSKNPHQVTYRAALKRATKRQATPPWVDKEHKAKIKAIYRQAKTASEFHEELYHVDHIEPLIGVNEKGVRVSSGLHVWWNLQILPARENLRKSNKLLNLNTK